jgi:hypothetical protein
VLTEARDEEDFAGLAGEQFHGFVDLVQAHPVRDEPIEFQPSGVDEEECLLPGVPESASEDAAEGDALLVDVGGDVDVSRPAGVTDGDDGRLPAYGFEKGGEGSGGA